MLVFALALIVKALVPAGYMPTMMGKLLTVTLCTGDGFQKSVTLHLSQDGKGSGDRQPGADHPCAFSALGGPALAATDPVVLAAALLFALVFALHFVPLPPLRRIGNLRPPLRGPPVAA